MLAAAALTDDAAGDRGLLVAARRGRTLHALLDSGRALTPTTRVRQSARPLCGRRPRAWRLAEVDHRPLCKGCERAVHALFGPAGLATAATWLEPWQFGQALLRARNLETVNAVLQVLLLSGHTGKSVTIDGQRVRLTQLVGTTRQRFTGDLSAADRMAVTSRVQTAPASRFPRRVG